MRYNGSFHTYLIQPKFAKFSTLLEGEGVVGAGNGGREELVEVDIWYAFRGKWVILFIIFPPPLTQFQPLSALHHRRNHYHDWHFHFIVKILTEYITSDFLYNWYFNESAFRIETAVLLHFVTWIIYSIMMHIS